MLAQQAQRVDVVGARRRTPHRAPVQTRRRRAAGMAGHQFAEHRAGGDELSRPAPTAAPAHSWCAARRDGRSTPAGGRPAHRRTPRCPPRPHTPVGPAPRPGRRLGARGSSSATARRTPADTAGRGRSGQSSLPSSARATGAHTTATATTAARISHMSSSARRLRFAPCPRRQTVDGQVTVEKAPRFTV